MATNLKQDAFKKPFGVDYGATNYLSLDKLRHISLRYLYGLPPLQPLRDNGIAIYGGAI